MTVLFVTHHDYLGHRLDGHPERPERLAAVEDGLDRSGLGGEAVAVAPRPATWGEITAVHSEAYVDALHNVCLAGGGWLDGDTGVVPASWDAALRAAGAGPSAVARLDAGEARAAFCAVRPPGHHAVAERAMGFCLLNNLAVTAAMLAGRGERVLVVDYDAHHGNGTQDVFYGDDRVTYVSLHQHPLYPGTGGVLETGDGEAVGTTVNVPVPAGATGDVYRAAVDELVAPLAAATGPTWLLISAGFDAHRRDPLTDLGLSAGDFGDITAAVAALVPPGRCVAFLEGGYDLPALRDSSAAALTGLAGDPCHPEPPTSGGPGRDAVAAAALVHARARPG